MGSAPNSTPSPDNPRLAWSAAALTLLTPCAGFFLAARYREGLLWLFLRGSALVLSPPVLLSFSDKNALAWTGLLVFVHLVFAVRNSARAFGIITRHPPEVPRWPLALGSAAVVFACLAVWSWHLNAHVMTVHQVANSDMEPTAPQGSMVLVDLRDLHPQPGDVLWYRCADGSEQCMHRVRAVGPTRVDPVDGKQLSSMLVPAHWVFFVGDNSASSTDSRQGGPVPRTNLVGRVLLPRP